MESEFIEFIPDDNNRRIYKPYVSFDRSGVITINRSAVKHMGLSVSERIIFCQDRMRPEDWYIKTDKRGVPLRSSTKGVMCANWKIMTCKILDSIDFHGHRVQLPIVCRPNENGLYAIITNAWKNYYSRQNDNDDE